jgi:lipopolysaccharide export LptBFGC system permease protein LptF
MKVLDRYIVKSFLISYLILAFVLIGLYVLADLTINGEEFTKQQDAQAGDVVGSIVNYYGHQVFAYYRELAGIITLASASTTLITMNRRNEMTALLASGVSLYRVIWPVLVLGLVFSGLTIIDQEFVLPSMADELVRHHDQQAKLKEFPIYACNLRDAWSTDDVAAVRTVQPGGDRVTARLVLENIGVGPARGPATGGAGGEDPVFLVCQSRTDDVLAIHAGATEQVRLYVRITGQASAADDPLDALTVTAEKVSQEGYPPDPVRSSGAGLAAVQPGDRVTPALLPRYLLWAVKLVPNMAGRYRLQDKLVILKKNGRTDEPVVRIDADSAEWLDSDEAWKIANPKTTFVRPLSGEGQYVPIVTPPRESLLVHPQNTPREIVLRNSSQRWMQYMSTPDLLEYSRSRDSGATRQARSIMHIRLTQPIISMIMLLLGVPFALTRAPVNLVQGMVRSVLLSGSCFICSFIFQQVSSDAQTWAIVAAWLPVIVFAPLGVLMLDSVKT